MTRTRVTVVALVLACLAAWALSRWAALPTASSVPHDPIDEESRAQLEQVLRESKEPR